MKTEVEFTLHGTAYEANENVSPRVSLATNDVGNHMNLWVWSGIAGRPAAEACLHPDDARRLRDALLNAYPIQQEREGAA